VVDSLDKMISQIYKIMPQYYYAINSKTDIISTFHLSEIPSSLANLI